VRVETFDSTKKNSIAQSCNKAVKTLFLAEDKRTTPRMCINGISRGDSTGGAAQECSPQRKLWEMTVIKRKKPRTGRKKTSDKVTTDSYKS
jgi:hypothetical protein